jgi:ribosome assembly protein 1
MEFLTNTDNIRNICILAHVDHGKTTIADSLIASNGIISHRMAGKMRYLDNRQDEQERGITMKSSSIALKYCDDSNQKYLVNLVDTPGHVDFCGEVSAAVRLCDGALIVVDVVEGICPQTKAALEQAWKEGIEPILVLNKIDRLVLEQQLDETAAHLRLNQLLEQVNAIVATLLTTELFEDETRLNFSKKVQIRSHGKSESDSTTNIDDKHVYDWASAIDEIDDDKYYFMPEKNNVIFASAIDDWAFTIGTFAKILSERHKINLAALERTLWGDFYIDVKQKRILPNAQSKAKKTLFTSMVLENIWKIYDIVAVRRDKTRMAKICDTLGIQLSQRDINHTDARYQTKLILSKWLQLSKHVLDCVKNVVPSPNNLSAKRVERLLSSNIKRFHQLPEKTQRLKDSFLKCSSGEDSIKIACVSKMIPVERKNLPENRKNIVRMPVKPIPSNSTSESLSEEISKDSNQDRDEEALMNEIVFVAFARVFSGVLRKGDKLYVLGPRHDPSLVDAELVKSIDETKKLEDLNPNEHVTVATVENFYLLMGRDIEPLDCALAGNIVGIQGLDKHLIRTATLSSDLYCPPFNDLHLPAAPILRVAIEPKNPLDTPVLMNGLKLLNQADPCVEVKLQQTGEHVIVATGEVHLQHCLKDLQERYANDIELNISQPIVPFRETIVLPPKTDMVNETIGDVNTIFENRKRTNKDGIIEISTPNKKCTIRLKASPIPEAVSDILTSSGSEVLRMISKLVTSRHKLDPQSFGQLSEVNKRKLDTFKKDIHAEFEKSRKEKVDWKHLYCENIADRIWSFGPKYSGPNMLVAGQEVDVDYNLWNRITGQDTMVGNSNDNNLSDYVDSFISGFQLASQSGPLCEEPMMGVCFTIVQWIFQNDPSATAINSKSIDEDNSVETTDLHKDGDEDDQSVSNQQQQRDSFGPMSGQIISTVKDGCRRAFQAQPQRLMSPMFSCDIQVTTDVLGKMYAVLARRHGRIIHGDMREGSQTFEIKAFIPVIESLDFVNEIRKQTSGMANPQLIFSHYETIDVDPFWTPSTEEEYTLYGEKADTENRARKYMNLVRRRKGLAVQEKIVEHAEKQRTIKRNK